jgi:ribosomal protein S12 methylthiotransferase accessory factor
MDIAIKFPGGKRVDAELDGRVVSTDQPPELGGGGQAPAPFDLFLASLATCAGLYVLGFCQARGLTTDGVRLVQHNRFDPVSHRLEAVDIEVFLPESFPEKYRAAVVRVVEGCKVKKTLVAPPEMTVRSTIAAEGAQAVR